MNDVVCFITIPSYPRECLLNPFHKKPDDKRYLAVKNGWKQLLGMEGFFGCKIHFQYNKFVGYITVTKSTRYEGAWQLTRYDMKGPYMHEDYADCCKEVGKSMRMLYSELARFSADKEIKVKLQLADNVSVSSALFS